MGTFSIWHWIVVLLIVLVLFGGRGKVSALMGDFGKGLKSFKKSMKEDDDEKNDEAPKAIKSDSMPAADPAPEKDSVTKN
ncbi:MAG: twin-arginine translocase TatA/TatE family subunit [Rhodospirillales bacterium]|jgi:sec-independent protein translocase protein TatA|nr:twin-arginine translocase TatA/TatE family subunit [Rhodospirillales bacterium]